MLKEGLLSGHLWCLQRVLRHVRSSMDNIRILEGLAASGLRSIRYALEVKTSFNSSWKPPIRLCLPAGSLAMSSGASTLLHVSRHVWRCLLKVQAATGNALSTIIIRAVMIQSRSSE